MEASRNSSTAAEKLAVVRQNTTMSCATAGIRRWLDAIAPRSRSQQTVSFQNCEAVPIISTERRAASLTDTPFQLDQLVEKKPDPEETVLYLGYGSNMSAETFQGKRGIQPLSQMNALVPAIALSFDLPGVPYSEPCFANVRYRHPAEYEERGASKSPYHKDLWTKGLVGIVYEVTIADFHHILATEGGGAGYQDVLVDCYALDLDPADKVPMEPKGAPFKAHTLFCPPNISRPDPSYAQPSARYLKLITDGANEHKLPYEYQEYLRNIRAYTATRMKQRLGSFIFLAIWGPIFAFLFGSASLFLDKMGQYPKWYARLAMAVFAACWSSYDHFFKNIFGDGERTEDNEEWHGVDEKESLIRYHTRGYGAVAS